MVLGRELIPSPLPLNPEPLALGEEVSPRVDTTPKSRVLRRNERGETPLHIACIKGDLKAASSLIEQGADVNATDHASEWIQY